MPGRTGCGPGTLLPLPAAPSRKQRRAAVGPGFESRIDTGTCRQWPEVYDLCRTFLHVARVRKHTDMREFHAFRAQFSHVRINTYNTYNFFYTYEY